MSDTLKPRHAVELGQCISEGEERRVLHCEKRVWELGDELGMGSYGRVVEATSNSIVGAAKFVRKLPGSQREILIADDLSGVRNVIPILDRGETDDSWVIVMP